MPRLLITTGENNSSKYVFKMFKAQRSEWFKNWPIFAALSPTLWISDIVFSWLALLPISSAAVLKFSNANALRLQVPDVVWNPTEFREIFWSTRKSDFQRELVKRCYYLMWKAQQNNFCFCYFAARFMLKAKIRFSERLCVTWFSLVFIASAFSPRQS